MIFNFINFVARFLKIPKFGRLRHFFPRNIPPFDLINRGILFSGYICHGNQESGVFVVSIATVVKGKVSQLISENKCEQVFPESFGPKQLLFLSEKCRNSSHCSPLLGPWTLAISFKQQEEGSKFYDSLMFRCL